MFILLYSLYFISLETKNPLAESLGGYENISIIHKLESPSIEFIRTVKDDISVGKYFVFHTFYRY